MEVTGVRIKMAGDQGPTGRLLAFCSVELDRQLVVHDVRVIKGNDGSPFVSMPAVPLTDHCEACDAKNPIQNVYCCKCGVFLGPAEEVLNDKGKPVRFRDIAHPVSREFRDVLDRAVLNAYRGMATIDGVGGKAYERQFDLGEGANGYAGSWG